MSDDNVKRVAEEAPTDAPEAPNAVLIIRTVEDDGSIVCDAMPLGDVKATEVQTVMELGLAAWRNKIGLR